MKNFQSIPFSAQKESDDATEFVREFVSIIAQARVGLPKDKMTWINLDDIRVRHVIARDGGLLAVEGFDSQKRQVVILMHFTAARFRLIVENKSANKPQLRETGFHIFADCGQDYLTQDGK